MCHAFTAACEALNCASAHFPSKDTLRTGVSQPQRASRLFRRLALGVGVWARAAGDGARALSAIARKGQRVSRLPYAFARPYLETYAIRARGEASAFGRRVCELGSQRFLTALPN